MRVVWLAALLAVSACTSAARPEPAQLAVVVSALAACRRSIAGRDGVHNSGAGLASQLMPGTPTAARICRYSPRGGLQAPSVVHGVLYADRQVGPADASRLVSALNAIPPDTSREHSCPADAGRVDVLAFRIPGRADVDIWSSSSGCWTFSNGQRLTGYASPELARYQSLLDSFAPGEMEVYAGPGGARGTVQGRLLGAFGATRTRPLVGKVFISAPGTQPVLVGTNGVFAITVGPGTYTLTGRSPAYNNGNALCRADQPVTIVDGRTIHADVVCVGK